MNKKLIAVITAVLMLLLITPLTFAEDGELPTEPAAETEAEKSEQEANQSEEPEQTEDGDVQEPIEALPESEEEIVEEAEKSEEDNALQAVADEPEQEEAQTAEPVKTAETKNQTEENSEFALQSEEAAPVETENAIEEEQSEAEETEETPADKNPFTISEDGNITAYNEQLYYEQNGTKSSVVIPNEINGISVTRIGDKVFYGCQITSIVIPQSVTSIGKEAFSSCPFKAVTLPSSLTSIGELSFVGSGLQSITIPDSVTYIGYGAFYGCSNLIEATIPGCNASSDCFMGCTNLKTINFSGGYIPSLSLGMESTGVETVNIADGITEIPTGAFNECHQLKTVNMPNSITRIGDIAFQGDSALSSIQLSSNLTSIGEKAFADCRTLASVTMPASLSSLGNSAFEGCTALEKIEFLGDAPSTTSQSLGAELSSSYATYYHEDQSGFTNPWRGYPTMEILNSGEIVAGEVTISGLAEGVEVIVSEDIGASAEQKLNEAAGSSEKIIWQRDISLIKDGEVYKPSRELEVTINIGAEYNGKTMKILHLKGGFDIEIKTAVCENGAIKFMTKSFSPFAVADTNIQAAPVSGIATAPSSSGTATAVAPSGIITTVRSPKTGYDTDFVPCLILIIAAAALISTTLIISKKRIIGK